MEQEIVLDKRKIIASKNSLIVTLPSSFCKIHGWEAGDEVKVKTDGRRLIIEKSG